MKKIKVAPRFELGITELQSIALPLGYATIVVEYTINSVEKQAKDIFLQHEGSLNMVCHDPLVFLYYVCPKSDIKVERINYDKI